METCARRLPDRSCPCTAIQALCVALRRSRSGTPTTCSAIRISTTSSCVWETGTSPHPLVGWSFSLISSKISNTSRCFAAITDKRWQRFFLVRSECKSAHNLHCLFSFRQYGEMNCELFHQEFPPRDKFHSCCNKVFRQEAWLHATAMSEVWQTRDLSHTAE